MTIHRIEQTIIPQTEEGRVFAEEYEQRLIGQGAYSDRMECDDFIMLTARYHFDLNMYEEGEG